jgi:hypothetical protein
VLLAEQAAALLGNREAGGRGGRQLRWGLGCRLGLGGGHGHGQILPCEADRPKDDLGREEYAADREPGRERSEFVAVRVEVGLDP